MYYHWRCREWGMVKPAVKALQLPDQQNPGQLFKSSWAEKQRKYAPARAYYGNIVQFTEPGEKWRLMQWLLQNNRKNRYGKSGPPQPFALIDSTSGLKKIACFCDETAEVDRNRLQEVSLIVRAEARAQQLR